MDLLVDVLKPFKGPVYLDEDGFRWCRLNKKVKINFIKHIIPLGGHFLQLSPPNQLADTEIVHSGIQGDSDEWVKQL